MITIRPFREPDEDAVLVLVRELQAHELTLFDKMIPPERIGPWYIARIRENCAAQNGVILVALVNGTIAGYATIFTKVEIDGTEDEIPHIHASVGDLVTGRSFRHQGVGAALLAECEQLARAAGRDDLRISHLAGNDMARRLYQKSGYRDLLITMRLNLL